MDHPDNPELCVRAQYMLEVKQRPESYGIGQHTIDVSGSCLQNEQAALTG
jgi:hypothetical protein